MRIAAPGALRVRAVAYRSDVLEEREQQRLAGAESQLRELLDVIALRAAAAAGGQSQGTEDALRLAIERVCTRTGWPVGLAFLPAPAADGSLVSTGIWYLEDTPALKQFRRAADKMPRVVPGSVPGRVLASGKPAWVADVAQTPDCVWAEQAKKAGLKSAFTFPVPAGDHTEAVLHFFSRETIEDGEQLLEMMIGIGTEIGRAFERSHEVTLTQQAAELYRSVVETSPDAIIVTDLNGIVLICNRQAALNFGLGEPEQLLGLNGFDFVAPEDRERAAQNARLTLETGGVRNVEYDLLRRDGGKTPVELSASVIRDPQSQPRAFVAVVRNISERRRGEEALRDSEEKFRTLTQMNAAATFIYKKGRLLYANDAAAAMTGYSVDELLAIDPWKLVHPDYHAILNEAWEQSLAAGSSPRHLELKLLTKDGDVRWMDYSAHLVQWEGHTAAMGTSFDITERKQMEEALRQSEERYRALYQDNPSMYFTVSARGIVLSVNQFGAAQLGYAPEELAGTPVLDVFHPDDKDEVADQLAQCVASLGETAHWEFRKIRKDGRVIHVKEQARATVDTNGDTIVLLVCEDVTERKRMEEDLEKAREELERKVERQVQTRAAYGLTFRELTILHLVATGSSDKDVAEQLGISPLTVSKHVANILTKMGAASRSEASARAVRESLLDLG